MAEDIVRVLRIIEYTGPRSAVEAQIERSLQGTKKLPNGLAIRVATIGGYPEILADLPPVDYWGKPSSEK